MYSAGDYKVYIYLNNSSCFITKPCCPHTGVDVGFLPDSSGSQEDNVAGIDPVFLLAGTQGHVE